MRRVVMLALLGVAGAGAAVGFALSRSSPPADAPDALARVGDRVQFVAVRSWNIFVGGSGGMARRLHHDVAWTWADDLDGLTVMAVDSPVLGSLVVGTDAGLYRSDDGGARFSRVAGMSAGEIVHAVGGSGQVLYACTAGRGLIRSNDDGRTWVAVNRRTRTLRGAIRVDPWSRHRLLAADTARGVVASSDGGRTWRLRAVLAAVASFDVSYGDPDRMVALTPRGAVWTRDGGRTWNPLRTPHRTVALAIDSHVPTVTYAAAVTNGRIVLYVTEDAGGHWRRVLS